VVFGDGGAKKALSATMGMASTTASTTGLSTSTEGSNGGVNDNQLTDVAM
jgi:hypothetical protein